MKNNKRLLYYKETTKKLFVLKHQVIHRHKNAAILENYYQVWRHFALL